jgi:hypothetical protein
MDTPTVEPINPRVNPKTGFFWQVMVYNTDLKKSLMVPRCQSCGHSPASWCADAQECTV